jgi:hypothetical protein
MAVGVGVSAAGPQPLARIKSADNAIQSIFLISNYLLLTVIGRGANPPPILQNRESVLEGGWPRESGDCSH